MKVSLKALELCSEELLLAIIRKEPWEPILDKMADAAGARAVAFSRATENQLNMLASTGLQSAYQDIQQGKSPPFSSKVLILSERDTDFVTDANPIIREKLEAQEFYQGFMVTPSIDMIHRASTSLIGARNSRGVKLSFFRGHREGIYTPEETTQLNSILPVIRNIAMLARHGFEQLTHEKTLLNARAADLVFELNFSGRPNDNASAAIEAYGDPLSVIRGELVCADHREQSKLDALIHAALSPNSTHGAIRLTRKCDGVQLYLTVTPIKGITAEVMAPAAIIAALIDPRRHANVNQVAIDRLTMAIDLTRRETEIASMISTGISPIEIARRLRLGEGTTRNYLKMLMKKCAVHSQVELASLITSLS